MDYVVDGDLAYEIDARQIPRSWPTSCVPPRKNIRYEEPPLADDGEVYALNPDLTAWAVALTQQVPLEDSDALRKFRSRFDTFPNALKPPFVTRGAELSASTFWHGSKLEDWANTWTRYYTAGRGNFMVGAMEDSGILQALTFLNQAGRIDSRRVLVLRTISNYDREPGTEVAGSLKEMVSGNYPAYMPSLEAAQTVGQKIVHDTIEHWAERKDTIPHAP